MTSYFVTRQGEVLQHGLNSDQYSASTCTTFEDKKGALQEGIRRLELALALRKKELVAEENTLPPLEFAFGDKVLADGKPAVIYEVDTQDPEAPYRVAFPDGDSSWVGPSQVRAPYKFKVGDRVTDRSDQFPRDEVGTVVGVDRNDPALPYRAKFGNNWEWFKESELALAPEAGIRVGDRVRYTNAEDAVHGGEVAVVLYAKESGGGRFAIRFPSDGCIYGDIAATNLQRED